MKHVKTSGLKEITYDCMNMIAVDSEAVNLISASEYFWVPL